MDPKIAGGMVCHMMLKAGAETPPILRHVGIGTVGPRAAEAKQKVLLKGQDGFAIGGHILGCIVL